MHSERNYEKNVRQTPAKQVNEPARLMTFHAVIHTT